MTLTTFGWTQLQLDDEERRLRQSAQHDVLLYTRLLEELALQLAPEQVEQCTRHNPTYFLQLDAQGWQRFFRALPNRTVQINGWGIQTLEIGKTVTLQRRIAELTDANRHLTEVVAALQQKLREQQTGEGGESDNDTASHNITAFSLPDRPPSQFVDRFNNWQREGLTLALLATTGWSLRHAIAQELARRLNITANAGSLKRLFAQVEKAGLWRMQTIEVSQSRIVLVTLTELGKQVMQASHIPVIDSEWQRLMAAHGGEQQHKHSVIVCAFTQQARLRGFRTEVCPEVEGDWQPDVALTNNHETLYVEVEAESGDAERRIRKWQRLAELQGAIALCALTPEQRQRLVTEASSVCRQGKATDLDTLFKQDALWAEEWGNGEIGRCSPYLPTTLSPHFPQESLAQNG